MIYIILLCLLCLLCLLFLHYFYKKKINVEHFCKVPKINEQGEPNYFDNDINFKSQSNISNNNCNKYWKKFSNERNSSFQLDEPVPVPSNQLKLPVEAGTGNKIYKFGLINFDKLSTSINDKNVNENLYNNASSLIINPINKEKLKYEYEVKYFIHELNKKTNINRFNDYNPTKLNNFPTIKSPIKNINLLNDEFLKRINNKQIELLSQSEKINNGKLYYQIYNYRILDIKYINGDKNKPLYSIHVNVFQEYNYFINSFAYIGFITENNKSPTIFNTEFIGITPSSNFLNVPPNDNNLPTNFFILNKNFNDFQNRLKDINEVINIVDNKKKLNELESNYACFNTDSDSPNSILKYDTKTICESNIDQYGRPKPIGIYDKPCEKDDECPFYNGNLNYKNKFGGCLKNGKCELPLNMESIGYHYYSYNKNKKPLCYNCDNNKKFDLLSNNLDTCCYQQTDKKKFPTLKTPDYAFKNDIINRINEYNKKNFKKKTLI